MTDILYHGFTPQTNHRLSRRYLQTPKSRVDEFLIALERAGYTHLDHESFTPPTGLTEFTYDHFFNSALDAEHDDEHMNQQLISPIFPTAFPPVHPTSPLSRATNSNTSNDSLFSPGSKAHNPTITKKSSMQIMEDFTPEALKKNWDMEEEVAESIPDLNRLISQHKIEQTMLYGESSNNLSATSNSVCAEELLDDGKESDYDDDNDLVELNEKETLDALDAMVKQSSSEDNGDAEVGTNIGSTMDLIKSMNHIDDRIHGDFNVWSAGVILSGARISSEYVGLHTTSLTHYNDNGVMVQSLPAQSSHQTSSGNF